MNYALVIYHKNVEKYPKEWIDRFILSLEDQTDQDFEVFELNYGGKTNSILEGKFIDRKKFYYNKFKDHADAMNYIYNIAFQNNDIVFNTNCDDYYSPKRISIQKKWLEKYDIVSSNYVKMMDDGQQHILKLSEFKLSELFEGHNIISNPCHAMHRKVFEKQKFDGSLIPFEDLEYWKLALKNNFSIGIVPEELHFYRVYESQIGKTK